MGYHASGDTRKMIQSSDDDEGYENQSSNTRISVKLNQPDVRNKHFTFGISQKVSPAPILSMSDDTDRPFWAEDELSSSESRQQLNKKQKRRHSLSYRNRIAVHRSRSLLLQSSSSSLDSISEQISEEVSKQERFTRRFNIEQKPGYSNIKKKYARKKGSSSLTNDRNIYTRYKYFDKKQMRKHNQFLGNKTFRP